MENDDFNFLGGPSEERLKKAMYQMKAEPWNRCVNETTYDTDDLTRLVLVSQELVPLLGNTWRSSPLLACQVWFRNFTPGEASHKEARGKSAGSKGFTGQNLSHLGGTLPLLWSISILGGTFLRTK